MGVSIIQTFINRNLPKFRRLPDQTELSECLDWWSARAKEQLSPVESDRLIEAMKAGAMVHSVFPAHRAELLTRAIGHLHGYSEAQRTPSRNSRKRSNRGFAMAE